MCVCVCVLAYLVIEPYMNLSVQCKRAMCRVARHSGSVSVRSQGRQCVGKVSVRDMCWVGRQSGNVLGRSPVRQCIGQVAVQACVCACAEICFDCGLILCFVMGYVLPSGEIEHY